MTKGLAPSPDCPILMWMRGLFATERRAWAVVGVYTATLYGTLDLAFDIYVPLYRRIGEVAMSLAINRLFLLAGLALLVVIVRQAPGTRGLVAFAAISLTLAVCLRLITVPAKRIHFFQYAPLTLLVLAAVRFRVSRRAAGYAVTLALVSAIGLGDEVIQGMLPTRSFALVDVLTDATAGLLTLAFVAFVAGDRARPGAVSRDASDAASDA